MEPAVVDHRPKLRGVRAQLAQSSSASEMAETILAHASAFGERASTQEQPGQAAEWCDRPEEEG